MIPILTFYVPVTEQAFLYEKQVVGIIFSAICIFGVIAAITPSRCSQIVHLDKDRKAVVKNLKTKVQNESKLTVRGHHPTCSYYSNHVLQLGTNILCTGCTGLAIGGIIAIVSSIPYFFLEWTIPWIFVFYWLGVIGVAIGLLQHSLYKLLKIKSGSIRVIVNVIFVIGAFFLLASTVEITHYFALEVYLLLAIIYWILTRIMMSKREHQLICTKCGDSACHLSKA
jgi:hypothetical protein